MLAILMALALSGPPQTTLPTLQEGAALAARARLPLLVWVGGHDDAELRARLPKCIQVRVPSWKGSAEPGVVAAPLVNGWPHQRRFIPRGEADAATVLQELSGAWLREKGMQRESRSLYLFPSTSRSC